MKSNQESPDGLHSQIAERAHALYLARGQSAGSDVDDWLTAEEEIRGSKSDGSQASGHLSSSVHPATLTPSINPSAPLQTDQQTPFSATVRRTSDREEIRAHAPHPAARQTRQRSASR